MMDQRLKLGDLTNKLLLKKQQQITDENFGQLIKPIIGGANGRESPKEPSPPKLRLYSRNSLRQHLSQVQEQELVKKDNNLKLIDLDEKDNVKDDYLVKQQKVDKVENNKQTILIPQQQQEFVISRIPRLSLKLNGPSIANQRQNAALKSTQSAAPPSKLAALTEVEGLVKAEDKSEEIEDIDKSTSCDAIYLVCDVAKDIYEYMYSLEEVQSVKEDYLKDQKILTPKVRQRLVNWCIEIHSQLKLLPETLYMTIAVIDRYFDQVQVKQQSKVQLVAVGATLIASKYEEIYPPDVGDLMHLTQNSYTRREILRIEIHILEQLNFDLGKPIPLAFLRRFSKAAHCDLKMHSIAKYLMELSLSEYECSHWRPSMLAAAALFTTIHLVHSDQSSSLPGSITRKTQSSSSQDRWNKALVHYTHYTRKQLQEPASVLCKILKRGLKSPQSYACVKKNLSSLPKWPELKSTRVDELIKLGDQLA